MDRTSRAPSLLAAAYLAAFLALLGSQIAFSYSRPPRPLSVGEIVVGFLAVVPIVLGCLASRESSRPSSRIGAALAILIGASCAAAMISGLSINHYLDPLPALITLVAVLGVGGWMCGQRLIACFAPLLLLTMIYVARQAGRPEATEEKDGIRATLSLLEGPTSEHAGSYFTLHLESTDGVPIKAKLDPREIGVSSTVGMLVPIEAMPFRDLRPWPGAPSPDPTLVELRSQMFGPSWASSGKFRIHVQLWPPRPLFSVRVPLANLPKETQKLTRGAAWLEVSGVGWRKSSRTDPPNRCLAFFARYANTGTYGYRWLDFRARDDLGHLLFFHTSSSRADDEGYDADFEIEGIRPTARWIDFDMFSRAQLEEHVLDLDLDRMALR